MIRNLVKYSMLIPIVLCGLLILPAQAKTFTVIQVIDGDTCILEDGQRVRYLGINAPEKGDPQFEEATQANNHLVAGKEIRLELGDPPQDEEGRLLAYVFVDEIFVNEELVRQGYAHIQHPLTAKYRDILFKAQEEARAAGRGIWANVAEKNIAIANIHADAEGNDRDNLCDEYIVIENKGDAPLNLTGWTVSDEAHHRYLFPNFTLEAKAKVTLRTCLGKNSESEVFWGSRSPIWNNDGDTIFIRDAEGNLVLSYIYPITKTTPERIDELKPEEGFDSPFGFMSARLDFEHAREAGGWWDRPFFELFEWGIIEPEQGKFNFYMTDEYIQKAQKYGFHTLANIQPFADWDQKLCHEDLPGTKSPMGFQTKGKPCDMEAYKNFVVKLVERYDGDGKDDMPGLKYPIKYWEVANEPEMQQEPLAFFQGSPRDYFEILKATYEAVKEADSEAQVVQGGMAGMSDWMVSFWQEVFSLGATSYFDIANMHSIAHGEHLNIPSFKEFLSQNNASEKPFWITEVQIEDRRDKKTPTEYAASLARSYIFALANGAKKLFYVNLRLPEHLPSEEEGGPGFSDLSTLVDLSGEATPLFYAHLTIALKLEDFNKVEKIKEKVEGKTILEGQYRFFKDNNRIIYALWGKGGLPLEIKGKVKVTDISGSEKILTSDSIELTASPIFIEKIESPSEGG